MSKKKRYEYQESESDNEYRDKRKSHRLQPHDRWRKNDYSLLNLTGDEDEDEEEWDTEN
jgi:hypothetical protein